MIDKWKLALKEFLKQYEEDDNVIGAVLCGSYASGNFNNNSDIDVYLVLKDNATYQERGNVESNSYIIEYFMSPIWKIKEYMMQERTHNKLSTITMFAYGKVIYDVEGSVKELQDLALNYIDTPLDNITSKQLDMNNYRLWDYLDELKVALDEKRNDFNSIYYELLITVYEAYSLYLSIPIYPKAKHYKILTDEDFRRKYHAFLLPEEEFIKLYLKCYEENKKDIMFKNISNLIDYYYEKQGGFLIRTFIQRNDLSKV